MRRPSGPSLLTAALLSVLCAASAGAQDPAGQQPPSFRTGADVVRLDVLVLDRSGQPVRGLTADDFELTRDGEPQPFSTFAAVELPEWPADNAGWVREVAPDVTSNRADARRMVVVVLDDANSRWSPSDTQMVRAIGRATIEQLGPGDVGAVVYTLMRRQGQDFTTDRARLLAAVDRFLPVQVMDSAPSEMSAEAPTRGLTSASQPARTNRSGACQWKDCLFDALSNEADILRDSDGRKILVLVSPGQQLRELRDRNDLSYKVNATAAALHRANISLYQFDPRGLEVEHQNTDVHLLTDNITGGRAITNTNAPAAFVPRMYAENSAYYLLGFQRVNEPRNGRFHRVRVRVRRPDVEIRTRDGYYADTDATPKPGGTPLTPVERALSLGLPTTDLPLSLSVVPVAAEGTPGSALAIVAGFDAPDDMPANSALTLVATAFNTNWKEVARSTVRFIVPDAGEAARAPIEVATRLDLHAGRYDVRVALATADQHRVGSVFTSATIPAFDRARLALSGLIVDRRAAGGPLANAAGDLLPPDATTVRAFDRDDEVSVVAHVYQRATKPADVVELSATILDVLGHTAFTRTSTLSGEIFQQAGTATYRQELPLTRLAPGEYLLRIEASAGGVSDRRDIRISVRP